MTYTVSKTDNISAECICCDNWSRSQLAIWQAVAARVWQFSTAATPSVPGLPFDTDGCAASAPDFPKSGGAVAAGLGGAAAVCLCSAGLSAGTLTPSCTIASIHTLTKLPAVRHAPLQNRKEQNRATTQNNRTKELAQALDHALHQHM